MPPRFLGDRACAYLDEARDDEPFFLMVSFPDPHHPFNPPGNTGTCTSPSSSPCRRRSRATTGRRRRWCRTSSTSASRQGQPHRHGHHRRFGARGAGGEGADLRHDRLHRRRGRRGARRARRLRQARRHRGDLHQRSRRPSRRPPADAEGRRAISEHRAGAVHLVGPAGVRVSPRAPARCLDDGYRPTVLDRARIEPASGMQAKSFLPVWTEAGPRACSSNTTTRRQARAPTCRRGSIR